MGLWSCGAVELWSCGAVELWSCGAAELWSCGAAELWSCGAVELWRCGAVELWASFMLKALKKSVSSGGTYKMVALNPLMTASGRWERCCRASFIFVAWVRVLKW